MVLSRRVLLASGAGTLGAAAGLGATTAAAQPMATGDIDLGVTYGVKAGQVGAALTNAAAINKAINDTRSARGWCCRSATSSSSATCPPAARTTGSRRSA